MAAPADIEFLNSLGNNLFSVAVAAFLLLRMEKRLSQLTDAINGLKHCQTCTLAADNKTASGG